MPPTRTWRRLAVLPAAGLVAALLTVVGAGPANAAECLSEAQSEDLVASTRCDDILPPTVALGAVTPAPVTQDRWVRRDTVSITFTGAFTDGDKDTLAFECQFYGTINPPASWTPCTSPATYTDLEETSAIPYTFRVRAVDTTDRGMDATTCVGLLCEGAASDADDFSDPVSTTFKVDTVAPAGSVRANGLVDEENPSWPMIRDRALQVVLAAGGSQDRSPVSFACALNGARVPCAMGTTDLTGLTPGDKRFTAVARDAAGNVDATPATLTFSVPRNLTAPKGSGWKRVREGGYFAGDFLQTDRVGATVSFPGRNVRELRLIAPQGPGLGKVQVKVGQGKWRTVNLNAPSYERFHVYQVRDQFEPLVTGPVQVRASKLTRGQTVRVDAVLAH